MDRLYIKRSELIIYGVKGCTTKRKTNGLEAWCSVVCWVTHCFRTPAITILFLFSVVVVVVVVVVAVSRLCRQWWVGGLLVGVVVVLLVVDGIVGVMWSVG